MFLKGSGSVKGGGGGNAERSEFAKQKEGQEGGRQRWGDDTHLSGYEHRCAN